MLCRHLGAAALLLLCAGPVLAEEAVNPDPWERFNRKVFAFNDKVDRYFFKPVAKGYRKITPALVDDEVNLGTIGRALWHNKRSIIGPALIAELGAERQQEDLPRFMHQRLYDGEYVVVMRRGHPLAGQPLGLDTYCAARHLLVSFSGRPFGFVDEALAALSRQRRVVLTVNQFFTAGRVVASTDLLTVLPRHFLSATGMASALATSELPLPVPPVHVDALWHRQAEHDSAHRWLREAVARAARAAFDTAAA